LTTKAAKVRRDQLRELLNSGCACHLNPPCGLCSELDEGEWEIFIEHGTDALLSTFDALDEKLESADRPMASAEEQARAALAAAEQRGRSAERAAIVAYLRLAAEANCDPAMVAEADCIESGEYLEAVGGGAEGREGGCDG
jgi:hypothetical protein